VEIRLTLSGSGERETRTLASGTLSIGRGERNDWVMPSADRTLSKIHCVISIENDKCILTDLSTNGVIINGARTATTRDSRTVLTDGDNFRLGEYTVAVAEVSDLGPTPVPHGILPDIDPLDDPLGHPPDPAFSHPVHHAAPQIRTYDPFNQQERPGGRPPQLDEYIFVDKPHYEWSGPAQHDGADAPRLAVQMPRVITSQPNGAATIDFDALIGDLSALRPLAPGSATVQPRPAAPSPSVDLDAAPPLVAPPRAQSPVATQAQFAERAPVPPAVAASAPLRGPDAALRAFLDGAGVPNLAMGSNAEAALRAIGQVFRVLTDGVREVLMSRAALKGEMRVEQTLLKASNNNALKFSFSPEDAVISLLCAGRPGYMPPLEAAKEAFDAIKTHEIAVISAMQTALYALLNRFDPDTLEARQVKDKLTGMLPTTRKARLWDSFCNLHDTIKAEADDDFHALFGRTFANAYKARAKRD
jgi:type VI secretion system FHA domain protein